MTVPMHEYKPPVNVSPLIKFSRWSFLLFGVAYGVTRHSYLQRKEDNQRESVQRQRETKRRMLEEEKKRALDKEMKELAKLAGVEKL